MRQSDVNRFAMSCDVECHPIQIDATGVSSVVVFRHYDQPRYLEGHVIEYSRFNYVARAAAYEHRRVSPLVEHRSASLAAAFAAVEREFDRLESHEATADRNWSTNQVQRAQRWLTAIRQKLAHQRNATAREFGAGRTEQGRALSDWCLKAQSAMLRLEHRLASCPELETVA